MISHLEGRLAQVMATAVVVDVGGVGMLVHSTPAATAQWHAGERAQIFTHLVVREESLTLYGFPTAHERDAFVTLQNVQGVGPKLAVALLSVHTPEQLAHAVAVSDSSALERVPGVGQKVAARLLLELGGKLVAVGAPAVDDARAQVIAALEGLGWSAKAASMAVEDVTEGPVDVSEVPEVLKAALQQMGGSRVR